MVKDKHTQNKCHAVFIKPGVGGWFVFLISILAGYAASE